MQEITIDKNHVIYYRREELNEIKEEDYRQLYKTAYNLAASMSEQLNVKCPDIGFSKRIITPDTNGRTTIQGAVTFSPRQLKELKNNLIIMALDFANDVQFEGTLAHEMRHIWQEESKPEITENSATGFEESLMHPAEIDADSYAIWYISEKYHMYLEKAAGIICPTEKKHYAKAYMNRVEKAKELKKYYDEKREKMIAEKIASHKQNKASFLNKIKKFIYLKEEK